MKEEAEFFAALKQAHERGWRVYITADSDGTFDANVDRGDSNCPHNKPYSRSDGHGYEAYEMHQGTEDTADWSLRGLTLWLKDLPDYKR